jgi:hypothetical protein
LFSSIRVFVDVIVLSVCQACLGSNRANLTATLVVLLLELATFMLLWLFARRYNDQLFIRTEGLLCLVVLTPVLCVGLWMLYDDDFRRYAFQPRLLGIDLLIPPVHEQFALFSPQRHRGEAEHGVRHLRSVHDDRNVLGLLREVSCGVVLLTSVMRRKRC